MQDYYAVIMAGGGGTRLWPLSRQARPKQMLHLGSDRTLFQQAVERLEGLFPPERILVVTARDQAPQLQEQVAYLLPENFLLEPLPRGTASVVGLAATVLARRNPHSVMAVLTADHVIQNIPHFQRLLRAAYKVAQEGYLVTLGVLPTYPATGYGYIQRGEPLGEQDGLPYYRVVRFKEKPDAATAQAMLEMGGFDWNSGMFIWRVDRILEEFERFMPELAVLLRQIGERWGEADGQALLEHLWPQIKPETIDYGIMERADRVAVLPAEELGWNDVGSWDSLFDVLSADAVGNLVLADETLILETRNSLLLSDQTKRLIATIGIEDLVIVDTSDVLLICKRSQAQKVREIVKILSQNGKTHYL
ncbi:mannose-1-phosphate guanylyltransferase [Thermanaerothrix sp. 4228-RoL]|uniref:Mannose-1-phosphate guanylyltransferase n=1 Tax=Thermanaerothrix solaris TaxID=3058434 RepID=A0ABU3NKV5_9CHLR|nr:mannose-1-phosphate guanylyltransferase [Thermanaerothrix sp. 4228-RoL]MDT8897476.1 mannose-1-phosphate guanylyltransferase [Thermanaerothrix sp. 4228-RoL]